MLDLLIKNVRVVRPNHTTIDNLDLGIRDGKFVQIAPNISTAEAKAVFDGGGHMAFPGAIDAHTHIGIYQSFEKDAPTETSAAVAGGCTAMLTYVRTGSLYLFMSGSWHQFFPKLLKVSEGIHYCDYGYHVSPIEGSQIEEMDWMVTEGGCPNFGEVFMFYGSHGLHGRSEHQRQWLMLPEEDNYDLAHFDFICREAARLQRKYPQLADYIQVSFHCENPEILRAYEKKIRTEGQLDGLEAYSAARPPHSEAIAIHNVGAIAHHAGLKKVNILHITSRAAMEAALQVRETYPDVDFGFEVTAGHLLLDYTSPCGIWGKVNPPLRSPEDREFLWEKVLDGTLQWVMTDHANSPKDQKVKADDPNNIWKAHAGFGGVDFLLPGIFSEGTKRGLTPNRVAELVSWVPSRRFGLLSKGDIAEGFDADIALLDPNETWTIRGEESRSAQGYTPFEGIEVTGRVKSTFLRGQMVYNEGKVVGTPQGKYLKRPG
jgi:allantoinase